MRGLRPARHVWVIGQHFPKAEFFTEFQRLDRHALRAGADFSMFALPTPVDEAHIPDFSPVVGASVVVGEHVKKGVTVVHESTVYPGATEEVLVPMLEWESGFQWNRDFHVV